MREQATSYRQTEKAPIPAAQTKASTRPQAWSQISGPVCR